MNDTLAPLNIVAARSFLAAVLGIALPLLNQAGVFPAEFLGLDRGDIAGLTERLAPILAFAWVLWERRAPSRRLTLTGPLR